MTGLGEPRCLVKRQPGEQIPFRIVKWVDLVVETGQRHAAVAVVQAGQQLRERVQRVGHPAAERPGVQVPVRAAQVDLGVDQPPHAGAHRRDVRRPHRGVGDHDHVAPEPVACGPQQRGEVRRPGLLLALDQQLERDRRRAAAAGGRAGLRGQRVEQDLALVVGRAAPEQLPVAAPRAGTAVTATPPAVRPAARRGGRRRAPRERPGPRPASARTPRAARCRPPRPATPPRPGSRLAQVPGEPVGRAPDVRVVRRVGGDRRDRQPFPERAEEAGGVLADVAADVHDPPRQARRPASAAAHRRPSPAL